MKVRKTAVFSDWVKNLRDIRARVRIQVRVDRLAVGNFGDAKFFDGIGELRVDYGPGYRIYFVRRGSTVVILICGGDKSTQKSDIRRAIEMAKEIE
ncbi:type II toxin-antitoxin system RelE/ParE family toxin [Corticibacterium sp. UT-5YL-CI-8]|nr:type II toxin-antitoxin system RelE/ParE family toxin [Tianweitania sp. UT-5YL-CI-8]